MYIKMTISNKLKVPSYNGQPFLVDAELRDTVDNLKIKASFVYPQIDPLVNIEILNLPFRTRISSITIKFWQKI